MMGCSAKTVYVCPSYPKPNAEVRQVLGSVMTPELHVWLDKQYKLKEKLDACAK